MRTRELQTFENKVKKMWEAGEIKCPIHLSGGNEKILKILFKDIKKDDYVFSTHRNHYHALLKGVNPDSLMSEIKREKKGLCKGRSGSMNTTDVSNRFYSSAIVGGICSIAVGVSWALKEQKSENRVWAFIGDGAVDTGHFYESVSFAEGWGLPVMFVVEDNDRSTCTAVDERLGYNNRTIRNSIQTLSTKVLYYRYKPKWPHVGSGVYVQF